MWVTGGSYQAWVTFLDGWSRGAPVDVATLPALRPEDFAGDSWHRLMDRITEALGSRLLAWADTLARELPAARDEFAAARALNHARWALPPIRAVAGSPALPEEMRTRLLELVDNQIRSIQEQIDEQVQRMRRSGVPDPVVEARLRTVRENPLTAVTGGPHVTTGGWAADPMATPRRRIVPH